MPVDFYGTGMLLSFEEHYYYAPDQWDEYLKKLYGNKYMELPPENKRRPHYPLYVRFENGTEIEFEKPSIKVTVEDTLKDS